MGLGDMAKKAKDALSSEKGEQVSDNVLDRGADLANRATGGKYADKIEQGRNAVDDRVGTEGSGSANPGPATEDAHAVGTGATGSANPGPGTDGVNAVGTAAGSGQTSGNTTAGATSPGPATDDAAGRHRADGDPDDGGSQNPGPRKHRA